MEVPWAAYSTTGKALRHRRLRISHTLLSIAMRYLSLVVYISSIIASNR